MSDERERILRRMTEPALTSGDERRLLAAGRSRFVAARRRSRALIFTLGLGSVAWAATSWVTKGGDDASLSSAPVNDLQGGPARVRLEALNVAHERLPSLLARSCASFVEGVGLHLRTGRYEYGKFADSLGPRLKDLGVRHIFDLGSGDKQALRRLGQTGLGIHLLLEKDSDPVQLAYDIGPSLRTLHIDWRFDARYRSGILDGAWAQAVRAFTESASLRVRGIDGLADVALIGPAIRSPYETRMVGDLSPFVDGGSLTFWVAPNFPSAKALRAELTAEREVFPAGLLTIMNGGYTTAPLALEHVSQAVQARYLLRLHAEAFSQGVQRTFVNELIDHRDEPNNRDAGLGLLSAEGVPKPAYEALRAMLAAVQEGGCFDDQQTLRIEVAIAPSDLRYVILGRAIGRLTVLIWLERHSSEMAVTTPVDIVLGERADQVDVIQPERGAAPMKSLRGVTRFRLEASDALQVVRIDL